ncbi:hypothetical protein JM946_23385 [Steroidobacter sp. S1-65]|uniref:Uncharacterized protein n=1 Tax=Steroidobacter gossypii TaxID=2805490 RepID=A0ABS1X395_9GAMM|nr:hypothetical protein [Steroidobacter gossypii]MBM0107698.1 hypothetical protein [Steroidobacter gossypii]
MNTLVLLVERGSAWSPETWLLDHGGERGALGQVVIERRPEWLNVLRDDRTLNDFEPEERLRLAEVMTEPETYLIEWRGSVLLEKLLRSVPPGTNVVVDNDYGLMVSVHEVANLPLDAWVTASKLP